MLSLQRLLVTILLVKFGACAEDNSTIDSDQFDYYSYPYYYYSSENVVNHANISYDDHEDSGQRDDDQTDSDDDSDTCFLCVNSTDVPNPDLLLRDETCEEWNGVEFDTDTAEVCEIVQTTYGSACGCSSPPAPKCNVCEKGDYIWLEDPTYFSYVDDVCVKIISDMSFDEEICEEAKDDIAKLCCINSTIPSPSPSLLPSPSPSPQHEIKNPKGSKSNAYALKTGKMKISKGGKAKKSDMFKFTSEPTISGSIFKYAKSFKKVKGVKAPKASKADSNHDMDMNSAINPTSNARTGEVNLNGKTQKVVKGSKRSKSVAASDTNSTFSTKKGKTKVKKVKKTKHHFHHPGGDDYYGDDYYWSGDEQYT